MRQALAPVTAVPEDGALTVDFFGREVTLVLVDGRPRAYVNACLHLGGPLVREREEFVCQWHGACFDVRTGERNRGPAPKDSRLMVLPTRVIDGVVTYVYGE